jgi:hypothetical protein
LKKIFLAAPALFAGLLTSCAAERDAASESEIALRGGLYSFTVGGGAFGVDSPIPLENNSTPRRICVQHGEGEGWIYKAVRESVTKGPECRTENSGRKGNSIFGRVACQLPSRDGGGVMAIDYTGAISEDAVDLTSKILPPDNIKADGLTDDEEAKLRLMLKVLDVTISMRREGDCSAY